MLPCFLDIRLSFHRHSSLTRCQEALLRDERPRGSNLTVSIPVVSEFVRNFGISTCGGVEYRALHPTTEGKWLARLWPKEAIHQTPDLRRLHPLFSLEANLISRLRRKVSFVDRFCPKGGGVVADPRLDEGVEIWGPKSGSVGLLVLTPNAKRPPRSVPTFLAAVDPCETGQQDGMPRQSGPAWSCRRERVQKRTRELLLNITRPASPGCDEAVTDTNS
jgi:hypothetical protein